MPITITGKIAFLVLIGSLVSCTVGQPRVESRGETPVPKSLLESNQPSLNVATQIRPTPVRNVSPDFNNFVFPWIPREYMEFFGSRTNIALSDGQIVKTEFDEADQFTVGVDVYFADLTADNSDEAIVNLSIILPNRAMPSCIFVYKLGDDRPRLLWKYMSGKRDVKGFKDIDLTDGRLTVEEFIVKDAPICCPKSFYKTVFYWNGKSFEIEKEERLLYSEPNRPF